ncbi:hypothetical protein SUDANB145_00779 [Streptomyces sp. enrichment culture]
MTHICPPAHHDSDAQAEILDRDAEVLTALDRLLDTDDPRRLPRRDDLTVRTERTVRAARRAS